MISIKTSQRVFGLLFGGVAGQNDLQASRTQARLASVAPSGIRSASFEPTVLPTLKISEQNENAC